MATLSLVLAVEEKLNADILRIERGLISESQLSFAVVHTVMITSRLYNQSDEFKLVRSLKRPRWRIDLSSPYPGSRTPPFVRLSDF